MKFSPCVNKCTNGGHFCHGCGRTHTEIRESRALIDKVVAHLIEYDYDDPENFLKMLNKKSLSRMAQLKKRSGK